MESFIIDILNHNYLRVLNKINILVYTFDVVSDFHKYRLSCPVFNIP